MPFMIAQRDSRPMAYMTRSAICVWETEEKADIILATDV